MQEPKLTHHGACAWLLHEGAVGDGAGKAGRVSQWVGNTTVRPGFL